MDAKQKDLFIEMAQIGVACGLLNIFEWYVNYVRSMENFCKYEEIPEREKEVTETMLTFLHQCSSSPDDPIKKWTKADLNKAIENYYNKNDEFRESLNFDAELFFKLSPEERKKYDKHLAKKRILAHKRDLAKENITK